MSRAPLVSVIMTVYNGERHVAEAIESIQAQTLRDFEFLIVDDGSNDRTAPILTNYAADPRIRVLSHLRMGRVPALNLAWTEGRGCYVANLDVDDLAMPRRLEKQYSFLENNPEIGLVGSYCEQRDEDTGATVLLKHPLSDADLRSALVRSCPFVHSSVMMPRRVLERVGGYRDGFPASEDYGLWVKIAESYELANLPEVLAVRRKGRTGYFARTSNWEKCRAKIAIRWFAWRRFSLRAADLYFVVVEPLAKWLNALSGGALTPPRTQSGDETGA